MKSYKITLLPGDGIGPEITSSAVKMLNTISELNDIEFDIEEKYEEWSKRCCVLDWPIRVDDEYTRKIYSMNKNEVGLDPNITPLEIEEERRYKRKPPNEDNITVRGMRYSK